jgi:glutamyl-tRNA reductase
VTPAEETLAALRRLGDETVDRLLQENERHWESMSEADRRTAELLARTVASRLFEMPARRLEAEPAGEQEAHAAALCRLFAVSAAPDAGVRPGQARA